jgi:three-Cys-motif partner protein
LPPQQPERRGGAAFIDLFAGPGRARIRETGEEIDGSPLVALRHHEVPFSRVVLCELDPDNAQALRKRVEAYEGHAVVVEGSCHETIREVVAQVPVYGLNFALIDPFSLDQLRFDTITNLAALRRVDLLIHFPTMDIKRNLTRSTDRLSRAVGTERWQERVKKAEDVPKAIDHLRSELEKHGYTGKQVRSVPIKHGGLLLYHLVFASKHERGDKIWESVTKITATGQRSLF